MASAMQTTETQGSSLCLANGEDLPILFEDEEEGDLGENNVHVLWTEILHVCLKAHLASRPELQVFVNMNLYYRQTPLHPVTRSRPYVSPDVMVVQPFSALPEATPSYTVGVDGPAPLLVVEVLSERSAQQRDLGEKLTVYAGLGVSEYVLADPRGAYLSNRLLGKYLTAYNTWRDAVDPDGGLTSRLGFRLTIDSEQNLSVLDSVSGRQYVRPLEAQRKVEEAQRRIEVLEAELAKMRKADKT